MNYEYQEKINLVDEKLSEYRVARNEFNKIENKGFLWVVINLAMLGFDVFIPITAFLVKSLIKSKIL